MSVILILILASLLMATIFLAGFIWSVHSGQYEDTTTPSMRVLMEESSGQNPERAGDQRLHLTLTLSRREGEQQSSVPDSDATSAIPHSRNPRSRRKNLPLPAGEGRGKGERNTDQQRHSTTGMKNPRVEI